MQSMLDVRRHEITRETWDRLSLSAVALHQWCMMQDVLVLDLKIFASSQKRLRIHQLCVLANYKPQSALDKVRVVWLTNFNPERAKKVCRIDDERWSLNSDLKRLMASRRDSVYSGPTFERVQPSPSDRLSILCILPSMQHREKSLSLRFITQITHNKAYDQFH